MKDHPDYRALLKTIRESMKAKGCTYAHLARRIGVSEVTVKRIFAGHPCTLERLFVICEQMNVSFLDVAALAKKEEEVDHFLSRPQEAYFADHPAHFAIFKEIYRGVPATEVAKAWQLGQSRLYKILRALEKLELLEVLPGNQVRMKVRGNLRMSHRGPLAKRILRPQILAFLDHIDDVLENDDVCMHSAEVELAEMHIPELVEEIHALGAKYRARAFRDKSLVPNKKLKSVRWLFAFAPFQTDWLKYRV